MRFIVTVLLCVLAVACDDETTTPTSTSTSTSATTTTGSVTTPVDAVAIDCGEDFSSLDQLGPPSVSRTCFLDANTAGKPARVILNGARGSLLLVSNADRTVEVTGDDGTMSTCAGLAPDDRQVFRLAGCDPPLPE